MTEIPLALRKKRCYQWAHRQLDVLAVTPKNDEGECKMSTSVQSKKLSDFMADFATTINSLIEDAAKEKLAEMLAGIGGERPKARTSVAAKTKGDGKRNYTRKHCPWPNCKSEGAPRWWQFCIEHGPMLAKIREEKGQKAFEETKANYIGDAQKPGGAWYHETKKRGRKPAAQAAA